MGQSERDSLAMDKFSRFDELNGLFSVLEKNGGVSRNVIDAAVAMDAALSASEASRKMGSNRQQAGRGGPDYLSSMLSMGGLQDPNAFGGNGGRASNGTNGMSMAGLDWGRNGGGGSNDGLFNQLASLDGRLKANSNGGGDGGQYGGGNGNQISQMELRAAAAAAGLGGAGLSGLAGLGAGNASGQDFRQLVGRGGGGGGGGDFPGGGGGGNFYGGIVPLDVRGGGGGGGQRGSLDGGLGSLLGGGGLNQGLGLGGGGGGGFGGMTPRDRRDNGGSYGGGGGSMAPLDMRLRTEGLFNHLAELNSKSNDAFSRGGGGGGNDGMGGMDNQTAAAVAAAVAAVTARPNNNNNSNANHNTNTNNSNTHTGGGGGGSSHLNDHRHDHRNDSPATMSTEGGNDKGDDTDGAKQRKKRSRSKEQLDQNRIAQQKYRDRKKAEQNGLQSALGQMSDQLVQLKALEVRMKEMEATNQGLQQTVVQQMFRIGQLEGELKQRASTISSQMTHLHGAVDIAERQDVTIAEQHSQLQTMEQVIQQLKEQLQASLAASEKCVCSKLLGAIKAAVEDVPGAERMREDGVVDNLPDDVVKHISHNILGSCRELLPEMFQRGATSSGGGHRNIKQQLQQQQQQQQQQLRRGNSEDA